MVCFKNEIQVHILIFKYKVNLHSHYYFVEQWCKSFKTSRIALKSEYVVLWLRCHLVDRGCCSNLYSIRWTQKKEKQLILQQVGLWPGAWMDSLGFLLDSLIVVMPLLESCCFTELRHSEYKTVNVCKLEQSCNYINIHGKFRKKLLKVWISLH